METITQRKYARGRMRLSAYLGFLLPDDKNRVGQMTQGNTHRRGLPLFFLPVVGARSRATIRAIAIAGQQPTPTVTSGIFPYSPIAHAMGSTVAAVYAADPTHNFGFTVGQQYDLKWPSNPEVGTV